MKNTQQMIKGQKKTFFTSIKKTKNKNKNDIRYDQLNYLFLYNY